MTAFDSARELSMNPQVLTITKSAPSGSLDQRVTVEGQRPQHFLAVDEVFGAAEAHEAISPFGISLVCQAFAGVLFDDRQLNHVPSVSGLGFDLLDDLDLAAGLIVAWPFRTG